MERQEYERHIMELLIGAECHGIRIENIETKDDEHLVILISAPEQCAFNDKSFTGEELLDLFKKDYLNIEYKGYECKTDEDREIVNGIIKIYGKVRTGEQWMQEDYDAACKGFTAALEELKKYKQL